MSLLSVLGERLYHFLHQQQEVRRARTVYVTHATLNIQQVVKQRGRLPTWAVARCC
jgi:hypothetical protein